MKAFSFVGMFLGLVMLSILQTARGEVIRPPITLSASERQKLARLVQRDPEAQAVWAGVKKDADAFLDAAPKPLDVIHYEGLLDTDPERIRTEESLQDLDKISVLGYAHAATGHARYRDKAKQFILAWVSTFQPTGNAINENKLEPVWITYDLLRADFGAGERARVEDWVRRIAAREIEAGKDQAQPGVPKDNWHAKRLKIVGQIGFVLNDRRFIDYALDGFKQYVADGLRPDGSSVDLEKRDALSYHTGALKSLLPLAQMAMRRGITLDGKTLYDYKAPSGASLRRSVEFVVPYVTGAKTRAEWRKTTSGLDRRRAEAGIAFYKPGKPYDPQNALEALEMAAFFDPKMVRLVSLLTKSAAVRSPSWLTLVNTVTRPRPGGRHEDDTAHNHPGAGRRLRPNGSGSAGPGSGGRNRSAGVR
jgi:hypothetical protein